MANEVEQTQVDYLKVLKSLKEERKKNLKLQTFIIHSSKELEELARELKLAQLNLAYLLENVTRSKNEVSVENLEKLYQLIEEIKTIQVNIKYMKSDMQKHLIDNKVDKNIIERDEEEIAAE